MTTTTTTRTQPGRGVGDSYADIVERLFTELGSRVRLTVITAAVRDTRTHLRRSPQTASPDQLERLARQLLTPVDAPTPVPGHRSPTRVHPTVHP